jgi:hypothetical protein
LRYARRSAVPARGLFAPSCSARGTVVGLLEPGGHPAQEAALFDVVGVRAREEALGLVVRHGGAGARVCERALGGDDVLA